MWKFIFVELTSSTTVRASDKRLPFHNNSPISQELWVGREDGIAWEIPGVLPLRLWSFFDFIHLAFIRVKSSYVTSNVSMVWVQRLSPPLIVKRIPVLRLHILVGVANVLSKVHKVTSHFIINRKRKKRSNNNIHMLFFFSYSLFMISSISAVFLRTVMELSSTILPN